MLKISVNNSADDSVYQQKLNTVNTLHTPRNSKVIAHWLLGILCSFIILLFLPWQQNIRARGELTALLPKDRVQTVESPIAGRIAEWYIQEGALVDSGQVLARIAEMKDKFIDPELVKRSEEQLTAKEEAIEAKERKAKAKEQQLVLLKTSLDLKIKQYEQKVTQKRLKVVSDSNFWVATTIDRINFERQWNANQVLFDSGLISKTKLEAAQSKFQSSKAKEATALAYLESSRSDFLVALLDLSNIEAEGLDKIAKVESERSAVYAEISEAGVDLAKYKNNLANLKQRVAFREIKAPSKGYVVKSFKNGVGETVKEGSKIFHFVTENPQLAVALYVKAMDVPLLSKGRHVRLRFDGWPTLQFSGWPNVSVGTFGGEVVVIDKTSSKDGKFRILITSQNLEGDDPWPSALRMGSGVFGWVMLDDVPIWYELWRQLNGFPPTIEENSEKYNNSVKK